MKVSLAGEATAARLNDPCACVGEPLFAFAIALLDDSVKVVGGVGRILGR
jgi:uncharacterized Zn-binding protein involved in type VI secretion